MPSSATTRDRALARAIAVVLVLGLAAVAVGIWLVLQPGAGAFWSPEGRLGSGLIGGPVLIALAVAELVRRRRRGPQEQGRHTRS